MPFKWNPIKSEFDIVNHSSLLNDDHTQYLLLSGRSGGQTAYGDTASGGNLVLGSTSHATKGKIYLGASYLDENTNLFYIGDGSAASPAYSFSGDADTGIYRRASNTLSFSTNGGLVGEFDSSAFYANRVRALTGNLDITGSNDSKIVRIGNLTSLTTGNIVEFYKDAISTKVAHISPTGGAYFGDNVVINNNIYTDGYYFNDDTDTGFYLYADGSFGIKTAGSLRMAVTSSLITVPPEIRTNNATVAMKLKSRVYDSASAVAFTMDSDYTLSTNGAKHTSFTNNNSEIAYIDYLGGAYFGGNVGIGKGAAGVDYALTFNGETSALTNTWMEDERQLIMNSVYAGGDVSIRLQNGGNTLNDTTTMYFANSSSTLNHGYIKVKRLSSTTATMSIGLAQGGTASDFLTLLNTGYFGNHAAPAHFLDFKGSGANNMAQLLETGTSGSSAGAVMKLGSNDGSAISSGDRLGGFLFSGYDGSAQYNTAGVFAFANEDYTGSAHGTYLSLEVTADSGNSRVGALSAYSDGVTIGSGLTGVDYKLTFDGESNDGTITWMEDERMFDLDNTIDIEGQIAFSTIDEPVNEMTYTLGGPGNVDDGVHRYKVRYVTADGETGLSPAYLVVTVTDKTTNGQVILDNIPVSPSDKVIYRRIFRGKVGVSTSSYYFVGNILDNTTTTFTDNLADADIGTADYRNVDNVTGGNIRIDGAKFGQIASGNMGFGYYAMGGSSTLTGWYNVAFGNSVLRYCTTGTANTGFGSYSLRNLTTGNYNFGLGVNAGYNITGGNYNNAIGYNALYSNETGSNNTAIGYLSLYACTGGGNLAIGTEAFRSNVTGDNGIAIGYRSAYSATDISGTIIIGYRAMFNGTDVKYNTVIGHQSGYVPGGVIANQCTTSTKCTFLGYQTGLGSTTQRTGAIAIGANATVDADYTCAIGGASADAVDLYVTRRQIRSRSVYTGTDTTDAVYLHICDSASAFTLTVSDGTQDGEEMKIVNRGAGTVTLSGKISSITATSSLIEGETIVLNWDVSDDEWQ